MHPPLTLRTAELHERRALEELQRRASLDNPGDREAILAHPDAIELPNSQIADGHVHIAERGDRILGFSVVLPRDDGDADLDGLFVEPALQRSGIGRALVEHGAALALSWGASALHVIGNPHAEDFYAALGFSVSGTYQTRFGPGLMMQRRL